MHTKNNPSLYDVHPAFSIRSTSALEGFVILLNGFFYLKIYDLKCYVRYYLEYYEQFEIMIDNVISLSIYDVIKCLNEFEFRQYYLFAIFNHLIL